MEYVLVKYQQLKILVEEDANIETLIENLQDLVALDEDVSLFYKNLLTARPEQIASLEKRQKALIKKIGGKVIGKPFDNVDAELYALDKQLNYDVLQLHGNTGKANAAGDLPADAQMQIRLNTSLKNKYVKQAQKEGLKLSQWVIKTLNSALESDS